jgi:microcystin-dependent protein
MSVPLIINGVTFNYPQQGDTNWGPTLTNWSTAVTNALQVTSNNFTLLTNHAIIFKDSEGTPKSLTLGIPSILTASWALTLPVSAGTTGQVLSTNGSGVTSWINAAGGGTINSGTTGQLAYYPGNGTTLSGETMSGDATIAAGGVLTIANDAITNIKVSASAAIARSKLATDTPFTILVNGSTGLIESSVVTPSRAIVSTVNGLPTASVTTTAELAFVSGVTSSIQTQINSKLNLSGGTLSGSLSLGGNKITSVANGTVSSDVVNFGQLTAFIRTAMIFPYAASNAAALAPDFLICDGSAVNRTTYSALFVLIGTTYGAGDGSTTFNIPNLVNNVPIGAGSTAALGSTVGATSFTTSSNGTHNHVLGTSGTMTAVNSASQAGIGSAGDVTTNPLVAPAGSGGETLLRRTALTTDSGAHTHTGSTIQPSLGLVYIIKT